MNRVIKFRAWDKNKKEMFDPVGEMDLNNDGVMQFTGLKDKNGKEIYEGDIVKDCSDSDLVFEVKWDNDWAGYKLPESFDEEYNYPISQITLEVIGNIYENPELLK